MNPAILRKKSLSDRNVSENWIVKLRRSKTILNSFFSREEISLVKAIFLSEKHAGIGKSAEKRDERGAKIVV